jgi:hypothetical protein
VRFADGLHPYNITLEGEGPLTVISPEQSFYEEIADEPDVFRAAWDRLADMFGHETAAQAA